MNELVFKGQNDQVLTNSLLVAEKFGKEHSKVMRDIDNLSCSKEFRVANFGETPYVHPQNGQTYKMYVMTKDGFSFLVMGYTGKRAGVFKEEYIKAFNIMDKALKEQQKPLSQIEALLQSVQMLADQDKRLNRVEDKVLKLDARTTTRPDYFTIAGYARMKKIKCGLTLASSLGRKAAAICQSNGYPMEETPDPRFGKVNTYPLSVLEEVFDMNIY